MKRIATKFDNKEAMIIDKSHPHYGVVAICLSADLTSVGWAMKFREKNTSNEFYVFEGKQIKWIN